MVNNNFYWCFLSKNVVKMGYFDNSAKLKVKYFLYRILFGVFKIHLFIVNKLYFVIVETF